MVQESLDARKSPPHQPAVSKIAEHVVLSRFRDIIQELDRVREEHFGFRAELWTDYQTFRLSEPIKDGRQRGGGVLDLASAFDSM